MSNLFGTISLALGALRADQGAMQVTADNIANVNTSGYTRRRAQLVEQQSTYESGLVLGGGVFLDGIRALRDRMIELRMNEEVQQQGAADAFVNTLQQIQTFFSDTQSGLGARIDTFFKAVTRLSGDATNVPLRQDLLTAGTNLAQCFRDYSTWLAEASAAVDIRVSDSVNEVNQLTSQIARLNSQIRDAQAAGGDSNSFEDQRTELIRELSGLLDISVVDSGDGLTLTASSGTALVIGDRSFNLTTSVAADGSQHISSGTCDITTDVKSGTIAGLFHARTVIAGLESELDILARDLGGALNAAHHSGFDSSGKPGGDLFTFADTNSAATMQMVLTDIAAIAASSDASADSTGAGNLSILLQVKSNATVNGQTATDFYASMVFLIGSDVAASKADSEASGLILRQLQNQRGAVSGVSLDEEAAELVKLQRAYEASARVVSVIADLTEVAVNLGRS